MFFPVICQVETLENALIAGVLTIAGSILVAVLGSTLLERKRQNDLRKMELDRLRDALYAEIAWDLIVLFNFTADAEYSASPYGDYKSWEEFKKSLTGSLLTDVYYETRKNPTLFYGLKEEAHSIDFFYHELNDRLNRSGQACDTSTYKDTGDQIHDFLLEELSDDSLIDLIVRLDSEKLTDFIFGWYERIEDIEKRKKAALTLIKRLKREKD
jgi:hypothetical protein